jgi:preprotein translocase subunit SecB
LIAFIFNQLINGIIMSKSSDSKENMPSVAINAQYVKDSSFESPKAPLCFINQAKENPKIDVALNLEANVVKDSIYEISIHINAKSTIKDETLFIIELQYAGLFTLTNIPEEQKELVLLIHCPTILFPFARRIIADITRDGGMQPLLLDPIDFNALYMQRKEQEKTAESIQ